MFGMDTRVLFFGTPAFAVPTLAALCESGRTPVRVITQPARPVGRGRELREPPVAQWAVERGLEVTQPSRVRAKSFLELAKEDRPDVAVVVAFGQIFPESLLKIPRLGCVNLHASLLPAYRGAGPIQAAIAAGDTETGSTTMLMEKGLDTGPILQQRSMPIGRTETTPELAERLAVSGAKLMIETLERLEAGDIVSQPQDDELASLAPLLEKEDGRVDWTLRSREIYNHWRAYTPWPGTFTTLRDDVVKIASCTVMDTDRGRAEPGEILGLVDDRVVVACGEGAVLGVETLQRAGRKALAATDFYNGERLEVGDRFV